MSDTPIAWSTDHSGMIVGARLHDAHISRIQYVDGFVFELTLVRTDRSEVNVKTSGMLGVCIAELTHGAILSEIFVWTVNNVPASVTAHWTNVWKSFIPRIASEHPEAFLVQFCCSFGGSMKVACKGLAISEVNHV